MTPTQPPAPKAGPGWYPDPDIGGGKRYFDGKVWTSKYQYPDKPPTKGLPPKGVLAIIGTLLVLILLGRACGTDDKKNSGSTPSSGTTTAAPTSTGRTKPAATFTTLDGPEGELVTAQFAIHDNFTKGMIKDGARFETIEILRYAKATYPNAAQVTVEGTFPMTDPYGNTSTDIVVNVTYLRSTLDKINFDGVSKDRIWEIRDSGFIAPDFRP